MTKSIPSEPEAAEPGAPLVIFGAGGMGREMLVMLRQLNETHFTWDLRGFYDDQAPPTPTVAGLPYLGTSADLNATSEPLAVAVAVGDSGSRAAVVARLTSSQLRFPTLVHPSVALQPYQNITMGTGCIIQQGVKLMTDVTLGNFVFINAGSILGHDAVLEDFCSLMGHVDLSGGAYLEAGAYLGTKATVIQSVRVGRNSILGAGAVAVRDIPANCTAAGVPARIIKR